MLRFLYSILLAFVLLSLSGLFYPQHRCQTTPPPQDHPPLCGIQPTRSLTLPSPLCSGMVGLPETVIWLICEYLDISALCNLSLVCRHIRTIADRQPWKKIFRLRIGSLKRFPKTPNNLRSDWQEWKQRCCAQKVVAYRWNKAGPREKKSLAAHNKAVGCIQFVDNRLISCDENLIRVCPPLPSSPPPIDSRPLFRGVDSILFHLCFPLFKGFVEFFSCLPCILNTYQEWNLKTGAPVVSLANDDKVNKLHHFQFNRRRMVISHSDAVRVYDARTMDFLFCLNENKGMTFSYANRLHLGEEHIVAGLWDGYIRLWNESDGKAGIILTGHNAPVYCLDATRVGLLLFLFPLPSSVSCFLFFCSIFSY